MSMFCINSARNQKFRLLLYDGLIIFVVFIISYAIRIVWYEHGDLSDLPERISWLVSVGVVIHLLAFYVFGLYDIKSTKKRKTLLINVFLSVLSATVLIIFFSFTFPKSQIGRILTGLQFVLMITVFYIWRVILSSNFFQNEERKFLVIGWNGLVEKIVQHLSSGSFGYTLSGFVMLPSDNPPTTIGNPTPVFQCLDEALSRTGAESIVITKEPQHIETFRSRLMDLKFRNMEIFSGPSFYERAFGKVPVSEISESWLLYGLREGTFQPRLYIQLKRILDFSFSLLILIIGVPVFFFISLMIKLDSKGPVFFKQKRIGLDEKPFVLYKFRTMVNDAEKFTGPKWASENDPRITPIGKILRKTHLDELPQFINVLKGEMSLVGPRPFRKYFTDLLSQKFPYYRLRFKVKPGITGWAQVNMGKGNTDDGQYEKLEYEVYYLYHQSIFLDLFIIFKTVQTLLFRRVA